jgi:hypothetical protein
VTGIIQQTKRRFQPTFNSVTNILSVDIEDYYQVEGFKRKIPFRDWERYESRFHLGLEWLLQILDSVGSGSVRSTDEVTKSASTDGDIAVLIL